jgi:hypothetical protein
VEWPKVDQRAKVEERGAGMEAQKGRGGDALENKKVKAMKKAAAPYVPVDGPKYVCDKKCGFRGSFDVVTAHEKACAGRTNMFVRNALGVMLVAKGENQLALAIDSTVLVSVLDLVRMIPPTASNMI